jgi:hypothetical protein
MANIVETVTYDSGVYLIATNDAVLGGTSGIANKAATNLANRTAYLKSQVDTINALTPTLAPLLSPTLTGTPKTAAPSIGDNSVQISTTAFVQTTAKGRIAINVAGSANVTLTAVQAGYAFIEFTGALTGNITVTVPGSASTWIMRNSTSGAYTITLASATAGGTNMVLPQGGSQEILTDGTNVYGLGYLPLTGGMVAPSGSATTANGWTALNTPTLRVADAYSGTGGGLSIESYQPTIQLIDRTASSKSMRLLMDNGSLKVANDAGDGAGVYAAPGILMHADGYMAVGSGVTLSSNVSYYANGPMVGTGTSQYGFYFSSEFNASATSNGYVFSSAPKIAAAAFTMSNLYGFIAQAPTIGTGATVTNYNAFDVQDASGIAFIAAYRGKVASGSGKWNLYLDGSANNFLSGRTLIGTTTDDGSSLLQVSGNSLLSGNVTVKGTGGTAITIDSATASQMQQIVFKNAGVNSWAIQSTTANKFQINRYDGTGTLLDTSLLIDPADGSVGMANRVTVGALTDDGVNALQVAGTAAFSGAVTTSAGINANGVGEQAGVVMTNTTASTGRKYSIYSNNAGSLTLGDETASAARLTVTSSGRIVIGSGADDGSNLLQVGGNVAVTGNQTLTNTTNSTVGSISSSAYTGGLSIEAFNVGNTAKKNLALAPWGGRVLIGTTTDDGVNLLQVASDKVKVAGLNVDNGTAFSTIYLNNGGKNRWTIYKDSVAESGSNAGGNFGINRVADNGTDQYQVLWISRSSGQVNFNNAISVGTTLYVSGAAATYRGTYYQTGGVSRWTMGANQSAESGSNAGSDFSIDRYNDSGAWINAPVSISRSTGLVTLSNGLTVNGATTVNSSINSSIGGGLNTGAFRTTVDIGGAYADWNNAKTFAVQIDGPSPNAAYGGMRWTHWGTRHFAAIEAYEGGSTTTQPVIVFHVANQNNAWTFNNADILRGAGGYVWHTGNRSNPVNSGTSNIITLDWGSHVSNQVGLTVDSTYMGNLWTNNASTYGQTGTYGYCKFPNGLMFVWARVDLGAYGAGGLINTGITFPVAFPNGCVALTAQPIIGLTSGSCNWTAEGQSASGFNFRYYNNSNVSDLVFDYIAIGY